MEFAARIRLRRWANEIRARAALPLRLALWNGEQLDLGPAARVTLQLPSPAAARFLLRPSLDVLGRAYIEGKIGLEGRVDDIVRIGATLASSAGAGARRWLPGLPLRRHSRRQDAAAIRYHYDVSNDFYRAWLDEAMVYSCAYFEQGGESLAEAQRKKIDHILAKIRLRPGQHLLDIGCGWGALVMRAAQAWGARCTGITLSENQAQLARERICAAGLEGRVEIRLEDYRDVGGIFDRITSVGMFEHVGLRNLPAYFRRMHDLLADDGIALNHGITSTDSRSATVGLGAGEFIGRHVFPQGELPHVGVVLQAMQDAGLETLDVENLRRHYAQTCAAWTANFEAARDSIRALVDERRYRTWRLYLAGCAHGFAQGWMSIHQVLCVKARHGTAQLPRSRRYMYLS